MSIIDRLFIAEVRRIKYLKKITDSDIAKKTGYSLSSIRQFMTGERHSKELKQSIAKALDIPV